MGRRHSKPRRAPSEQHRVGRRIRAREVRVIDHEGEQRGIITTSEAMDIAATAGLQLVEVNPKANPPVCKIMDYGKFKYENAKREREARKHQKTQELKEVKFRPKTHGHDFDFKLNHIRRFLGEGDKVKLVVQFRGREVTHPETGRAILDRVVEKAADLATVIQVPSMEGNRMNMVLAPKLRKDGGGGGRGGTAGGSGGKPADASAKPPPDPKDAAKDDGKDDGKGGDKPDADKAAKADAKPAAAKADEGAKAESAEA